MSSWLTGLEEVNDFLERSFPDVKIATAHGKVTFTQFMLSLFHTLQVKLISWYCPEPTSLITVDWSFKLFYGYPDNLLRSFCWLEAWMNLSESQGNNTDV